MKVLHITKSFLPDTHGGIEAVVRQLSLGLQKHNIQADVLTITSQPPTNLVYEAINIQRYKKTFSWHSTPFSWQLFKKFPTLVKDYDIVHYHYPWPFMDLCHFYHKPKIKTVLSYHADAISANPLVHAAYRKMTEKFLTHIDKIVPDSPQLMATSPILQLFAEKCQPIMLGIDPNTYPKISEQNLALWRQRLPNKFALFLGVLRHYKGVAHLIHAAKQVPYDIVIAGDGSQKSTWQQLAKDIGATNVHFVGYVSDADKVALLQLCNVVVLPSDLRSEAFGIALLEGAMFHKPLVSTELGTATSVVNKDGQTGLVVPPSDPPALAEALNKILANDQLAAQFGAAAYEHFMNNFTEQKFVKEFVNLYQKLLR